MMSVFDYKTGWSTLIALLTVTYRAFAGSADFSDAIKKSDFDKYD